MIRQVVISAVFAIGLAACGGGNPGPKPLKYHFEESDIALVPMDKKQQMLGAMQEYHVAKAHSQQATANLSEVNTDLKVAKNKQAQAKLEAKSAKQKKKQADSSNDMTRVNSAARELRAADLDKRAADQKVSYLKAQKKYLKRWARYTKEQMYSKEGKYELAKARVAQSNNIAPKGFKFDRFKSQSQKRSERAQKAKMNAKKDQQKAEAKKKKYEATEKEAQRARGGSTASGVSGDSE